MPNITMNEWNGRTAELFFKARTRWPWIEADHQSNDGIHLKTECCSAKFELRFQGGAFVPHGRVGSARSLIGSISMVERGIADYRGVVDVLHFLLSETEEVKVYDDGECPCDSCRGQGETRHGKCKTCEGKGKR